MKRVAIINDIHGNYLLLTKVLNELQSENIDHYIFGGDSITDGFENNQVLDKIKSLPATIINGNREISIINYDKVSWIDNPKYKNMLYAYNELTCENLDYIAKLPNYKIITIENKKICISHGTPYNYREIVKPYMTNLFDQLLNDFKADVYLFAHTHQYFDILYHGSYFINSGAINCPAHGHPESTYGILTIDKQNITYEQRKIPIDFEEQKRYYLSSDYYQQCFEWTNLILHNLKTGKDYACEFSDNLNPLLSYRENFNKYMLDKNLEIY